MNIIFTILIYAGIFQGFYMAFLLNHNKRQNAANRYLTALLVVMSLSIAHSEFITPEVHKAMNDPFRIKEPFLMLVIPFIWMYVKKLENSQFHYTLKTNLHFLPFVVFISVNVPAFFHGAASAPAHFLRNYSVAFNSLIWIALLVQYSGYMVQIIRISKKFKFTAEQELSNIEHVDISWIRTFLVVLVAAFATVAVMFIGAMHDFGTTWLNPMTSLLFAIAIFYLGYKGLFQQSIFSNTNIPENTKAIETEEIKPKTLDNALSDHLLKYMDENKPHRDPELTLTSLAQQVNMSRNQLSEVINSSLGCNFYDFVNKYRVDDVKFFMAHQKYKDFTILAIAFEAGFSSKSTFNSIFKKYTGLTPSEYRNGLS